MQIKRQFRKLGCGQTRPLNQLVSAVGDVMRTVIVCCFLICLMFSGCVTSSSVHPIFTDADLAHDIDLNGKWHQIEVEEGQRLPAFTCEGWDGKARYDLTLQLPVSPTPAEDQKHIPAEYDLVVGRVGGERYLQVRRSEAITGGPSFFEGVVTYTFAKVDVQGDTLFVYAIDDHALETLLPSATMSHLVHHRSAWARNIVLTESTLRMQEFLKEHHQTLFSEKPLKFQRTQSP